MTRPASIQGAFDFTWMLSGVCARKVFCDSIGTSPKSICWGSTVIERTGLTTKLTRSVAVALPGIPCAAAAADQIAARARAT